MLIKGIADSHCHYDDSAFDCDRDNLLDEMLTSEDSAVSLLVHACTDEASALFGIRKITHPAINQTKLF